MSLAPPLISHTSSFDTALLALAHSRHTIYEHTRMSGENRRAHRMLPVHLWDSSTDALEASYARNISKHFCEGPVRASKLHDTPMYPRETLLLIAQSQCSIYDKTRISGEYRTAHCMLPTDVRVEQLDRCSDTMDACYVNAMANYFVTTRASRL
uniref:Uncharacterized protein n=1 Tax=Peronospora matthiolae TaxID=2874970 RepID=A0AAV1VEK9_9STRA